jgi:hypothetical protein
MAFTASGVNPPAIPPGRTSIKKVLYRVVKVRGV